jgi:hypothetical protein
MNLYDGTRTRRYHTCLLGEICTRADFMNPTRDPHDRGLSDLVGELSTQSETFRTRWAAHNVRIHQTGVKHIHHPVVGDLSLTFEMMELRADTGLTILTYTAEPGSKSEEALNLLASWTATLDQAETAHVTDR